MKNIILIFTAFVFCIQINAQNATLESFYEKYKGQEDVTSFNLGGNFLKNLTDDNDDGTFDSILEQLYVLSLPYSAVSSSDLSALKKSITRNNYEELISVRDGSERVNIYLQEKGDVIHELLVLVVDPDEEIVVVTLKGQINFDDLEHINIDGKAGDAIREIDEDRRGN